MKAKLSDGSTIDDGDDGDGLTMIEVFDSAWW